MLGSRELYYCTMNSNQQYKTFFVPKYLLQRVSGGCKYVLNTYVASGFAFEHGAYDDLR